MEGTFCFNPLEDCDQTDLTLPILDYESSEGRSVTGGYVYRGSSVPGLYGKTPNPFVDHTTIEYTVQGFAHAELVVFNLLSERVRTLVRVR